MKRYRVRWIETREALVWASSEDEAIEIGPEEEGEYISVDDLSVEVIEVVEEDKDMGRD